MVFVIAYLPLFPGNPPTAIGNFRLDPEIGLPVYNGARYDIATPEGLAAFEADQHTVLKSSVYKHRRVRILPLSYFLRAAEEKIDAQVELARVVEQDRAESERLRALAEAAVPAPAPVRAAPPGFEGADIDDDDPRPFPAQGEEAADDEEEEEIPPYDEWPLDELVAEVKKRKLKLPRGASKDDPATYIAALEADDENDPD